MALSQSSLRRVWAPACGSVSRVRVPLYGAGSVVVRGAAYDATRALSECLRVHHYATRQPDTGGYVCRAKTGGGSYSLHAYGIAIDINWQSNPYSRRLITNMPRVMVNAILGIRTNSGAQVWSWGGNWSGSKDAMHYEIACSPADLRTGINWRTVPGPSTSRPPLPAPPASKPSTPAPPPTPPPPPRRPKLMFLMRLRPEDARTPAEKSAVFWTDGMEKIHVSSTKKLKHYQWILAVAGLPTGEILVEREFYDSIEDRKNNAWWLIFAASLVKLIRTALGVNPVGTDTLMSEINEELDKRKTTTR